MREIMGSLPSWLKHPFQKHRSQQNSEKRSNLKKRKNKIRTSCNRCSKDHRRSAKEELIRTLSIVNSFLSSLSEEECD